MKVLLIVKSKEIETLGPMYLSAVVKRAGHECHIVDLPSAFSDAMRWKPNLVGYSVMTGDQKKFIALDAQIKSQMHIASLFGGHHATFFPDDFPEDPVALGESEQDIADLLKSTEKYSDINSLPWPDRTDFPNHKIRDFITTRGCPYNCSYCFADRWSKMFPDIPRIRMRDPKDVVNEIISVNPEFAYFQDSCFGVKIEWLRKFTDYYGKKLKIPYHCHLRPNQVNEERARLLAASGCYSVRIALESANPRLRILLRRSKLATEETIQAATILKKYGINLMIQNMIALPTGTIEDDLETLEFNIRCKPDYAWCSIFSPYPGTDLGDFCKKKGYYTGDYSDLTDCFFDTSPLNISPEYKEQVECLQKVFALCAETGYMPNQNELTHENFPKLIHKITRQQGDKRLYGDVIGTISPLPLQQYHSFSSSVLR